MKELKHLDFQQKVFEINYIDEDTGEKIHREYFIEPELSAQRAVWCEWFQMELERGMVVGKQTEDFSNILSMCFEDVSNEQKVKNIAVACVNNQTSFKNFFENKPTVMKLCALFMNTEDEDRRFIDDILISKKISDWVNGGIAYSSFFLFAISLLKIALERYAKASRDISLPMEEFQKNFQKLKDTPISN